MTDAPSGYRTDIQYSTTYQEQISPRAMDFAALLAGFEPPRSRRYLELGYGQGVSLNIHAAASPGEYYGTDFNPAHRAMAQGLADRSGAPVTCTAESFDELAAKDDAPQYDYIAMHGVWSWVPEVQREAIVRIIDRSLAPGGLVYIGYDARPGADLKGTLRAYLQALGGDRRSLDTADALRAAGAQFFGDNAYLTRILGSDRGDSTTLPYHDLLATSWQPHFFSEVAGRLAPLGVGYLGPASPSQRVRRTRAPQAANAILEGIEDEALRETTWDFLVNSAFRTDLFGRAPARLAPEAQSARLRSTTIALTCPPSEAFKSLENAGLEPTVFALARDNASPKRIDQLEADPAVAELGVGRLLEHIAILVGNDRAVPIPGASPVAVERCNRLNRDLVRILNQPRFMPLASPVAGAGVRLPLRVRAAVGLGAYGQIEPEWRAILKTFAIAAA